MEARPFAFFFPARVTTAVMESCERRDDRAGIQTNPRKSKARLIRTARRFALGLCMGDGGWSDRPARQAAESGEFTG
jgi:hypothetical protein